MCDDYSGDLFKYKLGKWVLGIDECAFESLRDIGKNKPMRQYLIESIDNWVNKKKVFLTDEFGLFAVLYWLKIIA